MSPQLRDLVAFDRPSGAVDGYGGTDPGWTQAYACHAEFIYSRGNEVVDAARLQGRAVYKIRIRSCTSARAITTDYRMRDTRRSIEYQIREIDAITDRAWVYLVVESGVAV